ncbi:MAG: hypothetical protein R3A80_02425 [Bdellovibrionota bacterium]
MKKFTHTLGATALVAAITVLSSCGKNADKKDNGGVDAFGISESCSKLNTAEEDASTSVEVTGWDYNVRISWMGENENVVNFRSDKGINTQFEVTKNPTMIRILDAGDQSEKEVIDCTESLKSAEACTNKINAILVQISTIREQDNKRVEAGAESSLSEGKQSTLSCSNEFLTKKLDDLAIFIEQNTPISEEEVNPPILPLGV